MNRSVNQGPADLLTFISARILTLYPHKFGENFKPAKRSKILTGKQVLTKEELVVGLDKIGVAFSVHMANVKRAEEVIYQRYEATDFEWPETVLEFTVIFFKNLNHRVYKELVAELNLSCV